MIKVDSSNKKLHSVSKIRSNTYSAKRKSFWSNILSGITGLTRSRTSGQSKVVKKRTTSTRTSGSISKPASKSHARPFKTISLYQVKILSGLLFIVFVILTSVGIYRIITNYSEISFSDPFKNVFVRPELPYSEIQHKANRGALDAVEATLIIIESPMESKPSSDLSHDDSAESYIDHIYLSIWNNDSTTGLFIAVPGWVYYNSYARGTSELIEVDDMLYISQKVRGDRAFAVNEIEKWLGINIDSYILVDAEARHFTESIFGSTEYTDAPVEFIKNFSGSISKLELLTKSSRVENLSAGIHTNMSAIELYDLVEIINSQVGGKEMATIDLSQENFLVANVSSSGNEIKTVNLSEFDKALAQNFRVLRARVVEKEQAKVEVYNSSSIAGFASEVGRRINNRGLRLLRSGNSPNEYQQTTIYVSNLEKFPNSLAIVKEQLDRSIYGQLMASSEGYDKGVNDGLAIDIDEFFSREIRVVEGRPEFLTTGDIIVIIGQDIAFE